ncbi:MAG: cytochrome-c peroxidase [Candidatus Sericytochromatia bacterium]
MRRSFYFWTLSSLSLIACSSQPLALRPQQTALQTFRTPAALAPTPVPVPDFGSLPAPPDNPVTQGKVELGFRLWFEPRLSQNNRMTCATCHNHTIGFANGQRVATGVAGIAGRRNSPTIYGLLHQKASFLDGRAPTLEAQAVMPITDPIEMNESLDNVERKLAAVPYYAQKFQEVFGTPPNRDGIGKALASFERALVMGQTPFERYNAGDQSAMSPAQVRGMELFFSGRTRCATCHRGPTFSDRMFNNIGWGMDQPNPDLGRFEVTNMPWDKGSFKTPTLLNVALTGPYMHDGRADSLEAVVEHYNRGGIANEALDPRIRPLGLTPQEKTELVAFLRALSAPDNLRSLGKLPGIHLQAQQLEGFLSGRAIPPMPQTTRTSR